MWHDRHAKKRALLLWRCFDHLNNEFERGRLTRSGWLETREAELVADLLDDVATELRAYDAGTRRPSRGV